ncbi:asparagine synthase (glutamine-hydrolyzing) [Pseudomonas sp. NPDC098747]|uniref:asparagine synthase (glutamine-hydrolyzing) n=1 Tax=Pseudomonas sp. NPDC098747 TaxID=3364487 RepID=UPI00383B0842
MCGIAGWLSFSQDLIHQQPTLERMTMTMANRGPDAGGVWIDGPVGLGHRRLSIIDLEGGRQPMLARNAGTVAASITYSGEVYNFRELRNELLSRGHQFETQSDTEVVLRAYVEWGVGFTEHLNGMFAFAIWDMHTQTLHLVRDRMGVKPLYYFETADGVIFGSEPKALLANPLVPRNVGADGLREIFEMVKTPGQAIFEGMREVLPGEFVSISRNGLKRHCYWKLEAKEHTDSLEQTIKHTRDLLEDIVDRQIVADVPLCSLLSGGLDSSIITALASKKLLAAGKENIRSFSLDFMDHGGGFTSDAVRGTPDAPFVKDLVQKIRSTHGEILLDSREMADPELRSKVIRALDLPPAFWGDMWPSLYRLFEEVRRHSTVALSGESADEVFGGYRWFHDPDAIQADTFPWLTSVTGKYFDGKPLFAKGLMEKLSMNEFVADSYQQALRDVPVLPGESATDKRMREMTYVNLTRFVQTLLDRKDRMSMAVGLEVRVPFCDHRLVEYAFNIPWEIKAFDGREKSILRAATRDLLPASISDRVKSPYPSTQDPAYEAVLRADLAAIMADPNAPVRALLDSQQVTTTLARQLGDNSPMYDRMGMELAVGLNAWLTEYDVNLVI